MGVFVVEGMCSRFECNKRPGGGQESEGMRDEETRLRGGICSFVQAASGKRQAASSKQQPGGTRGGESCSLALARSDRQLAVARLKGAALCLFATRTSWMA